MFIHNTLELLATLIQDEFIQLSSKIVHLNFTVIVKILRNVIIDDKISNDTLKGSYKSSFVEANSLHVKSDIYEIKKIIQKEIEPYIM